MLAAGTIRIGGGSGIPLVLREFGLDPAKVIGEAGVLPSLFDDPENMVPFAAIGHLVAHCVKVTGCSHFGLLVGQQGGLPSLGRVGFVAQNSPDVGSALTSIASYLHHHDRGAAVTLAVRGKLASLGYAIYYQVEGADQIADTAMAIGCRIMCALCGADWRPVEVAFAHRRPVDTAPYEEFFRSKLRFGAEETAILFETEWLKRPLGQAQPELRKLLLKEIEQSRAVSPSDLPDNVRRVVRTMLGAGHCSAGQVAHLFGVSERTLHRRLVERGTSFKEIVNDVRYEMARQLLKDTDVPLGRIAELLDYSEVSAFNRAFVRWSGTPPGSWRKRLSVE